METIRAKISTSLMVSVAFCLLTAVRGFGSEVTVIANPSVKADTISPGDLRSVYLLERKTLRDGSAVVPVLQKSGAAHEAFLREYLERGNEEIRTYYQGLVFTGKASMPKEVNSDSEMLAYVARTKGAVGYISGSAVGDGVKVLQVAPDQKGKGSERALIKRVEPEYPEVLQKMKIGGTVRLDVKIAPSGSVESVVVLGGNPILAQAAVKAVKQWMYSPSASTTKMEVVIPFPPNS